MDWNILNLVTLVIYMAFLIYLGIWSERGTKSKDATGFLLADRNATLPWIIMSIFASGVGTLAYIGTVGMISEGGVIDLWFEFFWCIGTPIMAILFARKLRTSGIISFWDSISFRYGPKTMLAYASFVIVGIPFGLASITKGGGLTFRDMFPVLESVPIFDSITLGALILLVIIGLYLAFGGFKACLVTDMMQGILTWAAMIVPTFAILLILGDGSLFAGWDAVVEFFRQSELENFLYFDKVIGPEAPAQEYTYSFISAMLIMDVLIIMLPGQFYGQRYMAAKTEKIARQGPILALILTTIPYGLFINVTGLTFKAYAPEIPGDELFTGVLAKLAETNALPMIVSSLLLIALLAAVMGTLDSALMGHMSNLTMGVYKQFINPDANDKQIVRASRVILFMLIIVAIIGAFMMPDSIWFIQIAIVEFIGPVSFVLIVGAFLIKRSTWKGAVIGGAVGSFLALILTAMLTGFRGNYPIFIWEGLVEWWPDWLHSQFITYPIALAIFYYVNWRTTPARPEFLERFFTAPQTCRYAKKHGYDAAYVVLSTGMEREATQAGLEVKSIARQVRAYGDDSALQSFAESKSAEVMPAYARFKSWRQIFNPQLSALYEQGIDIAEEADTQRVGLDERPAARVIGGIGVVVAILLYLWMFWIFPIEMWESLTLFVIGSILMFSAFSIYFEDYRWCRRLVNMFTSDKRAD